MIPKYLLGMEQVASDKAHNFPSAFFTLNMDLVL